MTGPDSASPTALPAGPGEPPILQTLRWMLRPISFLESSRRRFGDTFTVRFLGLPQPMVMLSDPDAIRALFGNPEHGPAPVRTRALLPLLGPRSLLLIEGSDHLARRRLMLPPFHGARMRAYESTVREIVAGDVRSWPEREPFAMHPHMHRVTLEVILRAVFGVTDPEHRTRLADHITRLLAKTASGPLQFSALVSRRFGAPDPLTRLQALRREVHAMLDLEIAERRANPGEDILSMLVAARFEGGERMDDAEIRDQLMTLVMAGHETTAAGLAWTFDLLVRHPAVLERLVAEVDAGEQAYVRAVVSESLRLRPVVHMAARRLASPLQIDGHVLPVGTDVTPAIWLTHTRADCYPEPFAFRPERFLDDARSTHAWIPFGGGVRRCIGAAFAEMEMRVVLAEVLRHRTLQAVSGKAERVTRRSLTFSPAGGTRVIAAARHPVGAPGYHGGTPLGTERLSA